MSATTTRRATQRKRWPTYPALVRGDDGSLHVRSFATGEDANAAAQANPSLDHQPALTEAAKAWKHVGSPRDLSKALGGCVSPISISKLCKRGDLPCRDDGCGPSLPRYKLPIKAIAASVAQVGLRATIARHRQGILIA